MEFTLPLIKIRQSAVPGKTLSRLLLRVLKAHQDLHGAGGWDSGATALPTWLCFIRPAPAAPPQMPARAAR